MIENIIKLARFFQRKKNPLFSVDVEFQNKCIKKLGAPRDDIERGYFQYRCQMKLLGGLLAFIYNLVSMPLMLFYKNRIMREQTSDAGTDFNAVFLFAGSDMILPLSLKEKYSIRQVKDYQHQHLLIEEDAVFLKSLKKRYPFAWHFHFKCLMKIAMYRYQIAAYKPEALIVSAEYSFTSSVLTAYCESLGIKHINVMHGEKLFYMRDSFFRFHECYVWDEHYKNLFADMKAESAQFTIAVPQSHEAWIHLNIFKTVDFTYYFGSERSGDMYKIKRALDLLAERGNKVAIRPHPLYSSAEDIQSVFGVDSNYIIENKNTMPIEISVLRTRHAVSCYSTVLFQAMSNGIAAVIDDITDIQKYEKLKQLRYICFEKKHLLLSAALKENERHYNLLTTDENGL